MGLSDVLRTDLVLLHPPSIFDFRSETILQGPVADAVPSTDEFEMYPAGLTSIAGYLAKNQYNVKIVNLAYRMLSQPRYDAKKQIERMQARVFGVDLHWLPHAHGALAVAELAKKYHPESLILLGGLSSTYYHEELIRYPFVDLVLRGDSTEEPTRQLLASIRSGRSFESIQNLTWKTRNGEVRINPLTFLPKDMDYIDIPDYEYAIKSVFKYHSLRNLIPYLRWLRYPTTMLLNSRGCTLDCSTCGGSRTAYQKICSRQRPAFRSPEKLLHDIKTISSFTRSPIMMIHDPRMGGLTRAKKLFQLLKQVPISNEFVFELFFPAGDDYFQMVQDSVSKWSMELTIETPNEDLRKMGGLKFPVSNSKIEDTIASALSHGCRKLDLFFMIGIPHQTREDALSTVKYCEHLIKKFGVDPRLEFFIAPLGPFLDPGSGAFEDEKYGYKHFHRTLEEHREALLEPTWETILSYETDTLSRNEILASSYEVASEINELKFRYGLIDRLTYEEVKRHREAAKHALDEMVRAFTLPKNERGEELRKIREEVMQANVDSLFSKNELEWHSEVGLKITPTLLRIMASGLVEEITHSLYRLAGRYDTSIYDGK